LPLLETCSGSILVTSSLAGISPVSADPLYSMTKHAQVGLILSLTKALSGRGVRINALCPGPTLTRATREIAAAVAAATGQPVPGDEDTSAIDPSQPRMQPEEIAQACVAVLASGQTGGIWVKAWSDRPVYRHEFADIPGWGLEH
jgi:NAD(P)-dependent dehydrogenase (short-subunit alcohol dehydrogenase family)